MCVPRSFFVFDRRMWSNSILLLRVRVCGSTNTMEVEGRRARRARPVSAHPVWVCPAVSSV